MKKPSMKVAAALMLYGMCTTTVPTSAQPGAVEVPAWMTGCWVGTRGSQTFRERWLRADQRTLLGVSHTVKSDAMVAFEFLRVVLKDGALSYVAQPNGVPPTTFTATTRAADRVVFENPAHDFPKRVTYRRVGADGLTASIDGGRDTEGRVDFVMTREPCSF